MRNSKLLSVRQLDRKLKPFFTGQIEVPSDGWIRNIRNYLNMTQDQLARNLKITRQGVGKIEEREVNDSISMQL